MQIREEWKPLLIAAHRLINEVMEAGLAQRDGVEGADDGWTRLDPIERVRRMFMHLVATQTHMGTHGNPWSLTENTYLPDYMHATMGGIIVYARETNDEKLVEAIDE